MRSYLSPEDETLIYRSVGFMEYSRCLQCLDEFIRSASREELAAVDELVAQRDEFVVYLDLMRANRPSDSLASMATEGDSNTGRGLAWVTALARVELGAMVGTFTSVSPAFATARPVAFDADAYWRLMFDGARVHYSMVAEDPWYHDARNARVSYDFLTRAKLIRLTRQFLVAVAELGQGQWSPAEAGQLRTAIERVEQTAAVMQYVLKAEVSASAASQRRLAGTCVGILKN